MPDAEPSSSGRPIGQKASKARKANQQCATAHAGIAMAKAGNLLAFAATERLTYSKQKALSLSRLANHSIMSMDLNGLNDTAREFYLLEQKRILNETRKYAQMELEPRPELLDNDGWVYVDGTPEENDEEYDPDGTDDDF